MLSINKMASEDYYLLLAAEDYYLKGGEPPGKWVGKGAARLGLSGTVEREEFRSLFRGRDPDNGSALVQNAGTERHTSGWDFTFSVPKSVSVIWSRGEQDVRDTVERLQQEAVEQAIAFAEGHFAHSRTGHAGSGEKVKVGLAVATFQHGTSRACDPNLHTHACLFNVGVADDGKTRAVHSLHLFHAGKVLGAYQRAHFVHKLEKTLGTRTRRHGDSFEVEGVPQEVIDTKSTRRKQILSHLDERGMSGAKAAEVAALATRQKKDVPPRQELMQSWQESYDNMGFPLKALKKILGNKERDNLALLPEALKTVLDNMTRKAAFFWAKDLLFEALCVAAVHGIPADDMVASVDKLLLESEDIVQIPQTNGEAVFTTRQTLEKEKKLLKSAIKLSQRKGAKVSKKIRDKVLKRHDKLNAEQRAAFLHLVGSPGSLRFLRGMAGTGKTSYVLDACIDAWEMAGYEVVGLTPTGKAARVLEGEADIDTMTIHRGLLDFEMKAGLNLRHHLTQFVRAAKGKKTYAPPKPKKVKVKKKTIVIVDEAGMVNDRHFQMLIDHVDDGGGTLVNLGDGYQLPPVEGSAPFLTLSRLFGYAELRDIKRQEELWAREASQLFALGEAGPALKMYAKRGLIQKRATKNAAIEKLVEDWAREALHSPKQSVILALTNADCDQINNLCQKRRLAAYPENTVSVTAKDTRDDGEHECQVYRGDRIVFTENDKLWDNGSVGTVVGITPHENSITVELDAGPVVKASLDVCPHVRLAYAMTSYKGQGDTFGQAYLLVGGFMQNLPHAYVQATRARGTTRFYTTEDLWQDYEGTETSLLAQQMSQRPDLRLAMDLYEYPVCFEDEREIVQRKLVEDWHAKYETQQAKTFIIADTEEQADEINRQCHQQVIAAHTDEEPLVRVETENKVELVEGCKISFDKLLFKHKVLQGDTATVTRVYPDKQTVEVLNERLNELQQILVSDLKDVRHSYATHLRELKQLQSFREEQMKEEPVFRYSEPNRRLQPPPQLAEGVPQPPPSYVPSLMTMDPIAPTPVALNNQQIYMAGEGAKKQQEQFDQLRAMRQQLEMQQQQTQVERHVESVSRFWQHSQGQEQDS